MGDHKQVCLIMNADDFGLHSSVNEAVEKAHRDGVLTSASLVVTGEAFEDAVAIAKRNPRLGVGIHLTLNGEMPASAGGCVGSLIDRDGRFRESHSRLCLDIVRGRVRKEELAVEFQAQIMKFLDSGLRPTHIDSHRHIHLFGPVFSVLEPVLKRYGLRKTRGMNIPAWDYAIDKRLAIALALKYGNSLKKSGFTAPDSFVGFFRSGCMDKTYVSRAIDSLGPGVTEINFHPGTDNRALKDKYGLWEGLYGWGCDWQRELDILLDGSLRREIFSRGIRLINYGDI